MEQQDKKSGTGAPSTDTTSALFVSQRKKQLEQQEADRRAREKEEQRQAAEAEVRRLEQEVEERKRKAEEEAKLVAEEARAKKAEAQANPDAVLGAAVATKEKKERKMPNLPKVTLAGDGTAAAKPMDTKKIAIIGGAAVAVIILIIVIAVLAGGGGDGRPSASAEMIPYSSSQKGISFEYPTTWKVDDTTADGTSITSDSQSAIMMLLDITAGVNEMTASGSDIVSVVETSMQELAAGFVGGEVSGLEPQLQKSGSLVTGSAAFTYQDESLGKTDVDMHITVLGDRIIMDLLATYDEATAEQAYMDYRSIMDTLQIDTGSGTGSAESGSTAPAGGVSKTYAEPPAGYTRFTSANGFTMILPESWKATDTSTEFNRVVTDIGAGGTNAFMYVANLADEGKSLSGQDVYDYFVDKVIDLAELNLSNVESATDIIYQQEGRLEEYYQEITYKGGLSIDISVVFFNDSSNIQAVFMVYPTGDAATGDAMFAVRTSIEAA